MGKGYTVEIITRCMNHWLYHVLIMFERDCEMTQKVIGGGVFTCEAYVKEL